MRWIGKCAVFASTAAVAVAMVAPGTASAKAPVDASGTLHCAISGTVKIAPKLVFGGTTPGGSLFLAKVKGTCTGTSGVTSVKANLKARLPSNDCTALAASGFPAADLGPAKFKGPGVHYTGSTTNFTSGGTFTTADPITLSLPGSGSSSIASGSFAGQHPTISLVFDQQVSDFVSACGPRQKGVKNSGGLKKLTFGTTSSLDIS